MPTTLDFLAQIGRTTAQGGPSRMHDPRYLEQHYTDRLAHQRGLQEQMSQKVINGVTMPDMGAWHKVQRGKFRDLQDLHGDRQDTMNREMEFVRQEEWPKMNFRTDYSNLPRNFQNLGEEQRQVGVAQQRDQAAVAEGRNPVAMQALQALLRRPIR